MKCKCGHDWNFHNVLDNEACHEMYCKCNKYSPKRQPKTAQNQLKESCPHDTSVRGGAEKVK